LEGLVGQLLEPLFPVSKGIRLLGVTLSSLEAEGELRVGQQMLLPI
jgi:DNA polymerase IV